MYQPGQQPQQQAHGSTALSVHVANARNLKDMDTLGKQDVFVLLTSDIAGSNSVRTFTHKDGGTQPTWNQELRLDPHGASELYVELWDEDPTADDISGFCAVPLNQIPINAWFQLFTLDGKPKGEVNLIITPQGSAGPPSQQVRGISGINPQHQKNLVNKGRKAMAMDAGVGLLGVGMAAGAAYLGQQLYEKQQAKEHGSTPAHTQSGGSGEEKHHGDHGHHDSHEGHKEKEGHHHGGARKWDPVGTYSTGDRIEHNGRQWTCLQGFTSNPTWTPEAAPSLWREE